MAQLVEFPRRPKPDPDGVRFSYGFNRWCAEHFRGDRCVGRTTFDFLDNARAEVERLEAQGRRRLPDIKPDWSAVAYGPLSGGMDPDDDGHGGGFAA